MNSIKKPGLAFVAFGNDTGLKRCRLLDLRSEKIGEARELPGSTARLGLFSIKISDTEITGSVSFRDYGEIRSIEFKDGKEGEIGSLTEDGGIWRLEWAGRRSPVHMKNAGTWGRIPTLHFTGLGYPGDIGYFVKMDTETPLFALPKNIGRLFTRKRPVITGPAGTVNHDRTSGILPVLIAFRMFHRGGDFSSAG